MDITVGIIGATGTIGMQLTRMLHTHPNVTRVFPMSARLAGKPFSTLHYSYRDMSSVKLYPQSKEQAIDCDVLFLCKMDEHVRKMLQLIVDTHDKTTLPVVIDVTPEHRGSNGPEAYEPGGLLDPLFFTCLPELNGGNYPTGRWISAPGCVPTATNLGLWPLLANDVLGSLRIIVDAKVASSGAGTSNPGYAQLHQNRANGVRAFRLQREHQHASEIMAFQYHLTGQEPLLGLNVFSVDMIRGISAAIYFQGAPGQNERSLRKLFRDAYRGCNTVRVLSGMDSPERHPNPKWLCGTGLCDLSVTYDEDTGDGVILSAIDNLMKGGASQAVQLLNLAMNFDSCAGIPLVPQYP